MRWGVYEVGSVGDRELSYVSTCADTDTATV